MIPITHFLFLGRFCGFCHAGWWITYRSISRDVMDQRAAILVYLSYCIITCKSMQTQSKTRSQTSTAMNFSTNTANLKDPNESPDPQPSPPVSDYAKKAWFNRKKPIFGQDRVHWNWPCVSDAKPDRIFTLLIPYCTKQYVKNHIFPQLVNIIPQKYNVTFIFNTLPYP